MSRARGRWRAGLVLVVAATLGMGAAVAPAARTVRTSAPLTGSQFQGGDGNQVDEAPYIDWQGLLASGRVQHTSDLTSPDNSFVGGTEEGRPGEWAIRGFAVTPADSDVLDMYSAVDRNLETGDVFVYLAFTRADSTGGSTYLAFDLNQDPLMWRPAGGTEDVPCRKTGDILIAYTTTGGQSSIGISRWVTTSAAANGCALTGNVVAASGVDYQAAINATAIPASQNYLPGHFQNSAIPLRQFGEAAINLTKALASLPGEGCDEFASTWMHTRTGNSITAALKDYVRPHRLPIAICKRHPQLSTVTAPRVTVGQEIFDTAHLSGGFAPTGQLTFRLYGPGNRSCRGRPVFTFVSTVDGNGDYSSGSFATSRAGTYRWVVSYTGDVNNEPAGPTGCGESSETVRVGRAGPTLSSTASGPVQVQPGGGSRRRRQAASVHVARAIEPIHDVAHLSGGFEPTGVITFRLYGPGEADCSGRPIFTSRVAVNGNGDYPSEPFTPPRAGTYHWVVSYSGDHNNRPAGRTACGVDSETTVVLRAEPTIVTQASGTVEVGQPISDTAFLSRAADPRGRITFRVYGPDDLDCSRTPAHTAGVRVSGNGAYPSGDFTPTRAGTYIWVARYSGDRNNSPTSSSCDDATEHVVVSRPPLGQPTLTTTASAGAPAGSPIHDTAHLSGGNAPTGTITFRLYGPDDSRCTGTPSEQVFVHATGPGDWPSPAVRPSQAGTYYWVAEYGGDEHNHGVGPTDCGVAAERVDISPAQPALRTAASPSASVGLPVLDTAFLSGGSNPTGTITFTLFGPNNPTCTPPAASTPAALTVVGNGRYRSPAVVPRQAGTYQWKVTYSGDANNHAMSICGGSGETVVVPRRLPLLTTSASPPANVLPKRSRVQSAGLEIYDSARLRFAHSPTGRIVFALFGPDNATCSGTPIFTSATEVNGNGVYNSDKKVVTASGVYRWVATYSGDANNRPRVTACGAQTEQVRVTVPADTQLTTAASAAVEVGGAIHDTAFLSNGASPTGTITFRLYGSGDTGCSGDPIFTSKVAVTGNGPHVSGSFAPAGPGVYRWVAEYSGDHANHPAGPTGCGDPTELGIVRPPAITPVVPALSTTASQYPAGGQTLYDIAHLAGGTDPSGSIVFELFGPDDQTCSGPPAFTSVVAAEGNGDYRSATFTVPGPGTYRWVVTYSGDALNVSVGPTACGDSSETSVASATPAPTPDPGPDEEAIGAVRPTPRPKPRPKPPPPPRRPPPPVVTG